MLITYNMIISYIQVYLVSTASFDHLYAFVFTRQSLMGSGRKLNIAYNRGE